MNYRIPKLKLLNMNITTRLLCLISFGLLINLYAFSQKLDSTIIDGEQFYIYPFKAKVRSHGDYFLLIDNINNGRINYKKFVKLSQEIDPERKVLSREEFREIKDLLKVSNNFMNERKYINRKFVKAARKNPYPLLEQYFSENIDIIPSLDPLPDGKYIQYYDPICVVDKKGNCQMEKTFIAAYFNLRNNTMDGEATWVNFQNDTLKHGWFENGLKSGVWTFVERSPARRLDEHDVDSYIELGYPNQDTIINIIEFKDGARNGKYIKYSNSKYPVEEGFYSEGKKIGEWIYREVQTYYDENFNEIRNRNNAQITEHYTLNSNDSLIVCVPWIRNGKYNCYGADRTQFNFYSENELSDLPTLYDIAFKKNNDVPDNISEELYYSNLEFSDYRYYGSDFNALQVVVFDPEDEVNKKRGILLDSVGAIPRYTGVYEKFYGNGQLMMRFVFDEGRLVEEGDLYWDNGNIHDKIRFIADSNHYLREIFDYDGKPYKEIVYDELGDFKHIQESYEEVSYTLLDGLKATESEYGQFYMYYNYDTLAHELDDEVVLYRSWYTGDSSMIFTTNFDPNSRTVRSKSIAASGKISYENKSVFAEDFESWTGGSSHYFSDLKLNNTASGAMYEMMEKDTIPQRNVGESFMLFDVASDYQLFKNETPYSGDVNIEFSGKKIKISKKGMDVKLPRSYKHIHKVEADFEEARKTGKSRYPVLFNYTDETGLSKSIGTMIYDDIFENLFDGFFQVGGEYGYYEYEFEEYQNGRSDYPELTKISGYLMDGKPHGVWIGLDQFNNKMLEVPYKNGVTDGRVVNYNYQYPREDSWNEFEISTIDSFPKKKLHYISSIADYKNGFKDGVEIFYDWQGNITSRSNYKEGLLDGETIERNKIAFTRSNFENGALDGYVQTYLVLPDRDSILLFDLNFQDGLLQGESKSYHTNGRLAKRGFFLNGESIEDYEAYDSLGTKYHYVKFQYSFPVEEKIWEENELSVRYQFDWQDSIYFEPSDITSSQSLESILYKYGYMEGFYNQPYYGRPSLVDKSGIDYQLTKYYPNDTVARDGLMSKGNKAGCWKYYSYDGELLYEVDYFDSTIVLNDSIKFNSRGVYTEIDADGDILHESYIIEKSEKYDCSHSDHYEVRQYLTKWSLDTENRMNGFVKNYYDNGTLQSEGKMEDGLPTGEWKFYDPYGKLHEYGYYILGKRNGRWLKGDLSKTKYLGDICLNPNLPDLEEEIKYRENLLDITITSYKYGKILNRQYYDVDMNQFKEKDEEAPVEE